MKKLFITGISFLLMINSAFSQSNNIVEYNNEILYHYTLLDNNIANFEQSIWNENVSPAELKKIYNHCKNICKYNGKIIKNFTPISSDKYFHKSVVQYYNDVENVLANEYKEIINLYSIEWQDSFGEKIKNLDEKAVEKIIKSENNVIEMQKKFAEDNNLRLD